MGRILKEYGEESNWYFLQNKIVKARVGGGLHSTADLVDLIRTTTSKTKGTDSLISAQLFQGFFKGYVLFLNQSSRSISMGHLGPVL